MDNYETAYQLNINHILIYLNADHNGVKFGADPDCIEIFDAFVKSLRLVKAKVEIDIRDGFLSDEKLGGICYLLANNVNEGGVQSIDE